jgi:hypothetical protein
MLPENETKRPFVGRFFFVTFLLLALAGTWRFATTEDATWSLAVRHGQITDLDSTKGRLVFTRLLADEVAVVREDWEVTFPAHRPVRLVSDGHGGHYVLGLLSNEVTHLGSQGEMLGVTTFPESVFITGLMAEAKLVWVTGYFKSRYEERPKKYIYLPEYSRYLWFVQRINYVLTPGDQQIPERPSIHGVTRWHEESGGSWLILGDYRALFVVNDQAETLTRVDGVGESILWTSPTAPRPTAALQVGERILVLSSQGGVAQMFNTETGGLEAEVKVGEGVTDVALFGEGLVFSDWRHNRLVVADSTGLPIETIALPGGPRSLSAEGDSLWVALDAANELVQLNRDFQIVERVVLGGEGNR